MNIPVWKKYCVEQLTTQELLDELVKREGVERFIVDSEDSGEVAIRYSVAKTVGLHEIKEEATILVVRKP